MKFYLVVLKIFIVAALLIIANYDLALKEKENRQTFYHYYYTWLTEFFDKGLFVTGYVVRSEWLPDTTTFKNVTT